MSSIVSTLRDLYPLITVAVFFGFYIFSAFCVRYAHDERVKKLFIAALIIGLIVPTLTGIKFPPFFSFWKFTDPATETSTGYNIVIVDGNGTEYTIDGSATPPRVPGNYFSKDIDNKSKEKMACYLMNEVTEYQNSVKENDLTLADRIRRGVPIFSRLVGREPTWGSTLSPSAPDTIIQKLRVYKTTKTASSDGIDIVNQNRTIVDEYNISRC